MYSEIILEVLKYILYSLCTKIPYKWDFCRVFLEENVRLCINVGSYFIAYIAFIFWFTKYVLWELQCLAGDKLGKRHWYSAIGLSLCTGIHFLWPAFLMSTYFVSCSFYPWFSATLVFFLNVNFFMPSLFVDGARKTKSMIHVAFARWKKKTESQSSTDFTDYISPDSSEESLTAVFGSSENNPGMENKETASTEKQPMERLKSQVLSSIRVGIDKIKSLFQTAFDRLNMFKVQSETISGSNMDIKDSDETGKQLAESARVSSSFDDKNFLYSIFEKARSFYDISDEFNILQPNSSSYEINNTSDVFRLDKSISEPQQPDKFKDDDSQPDGNRVYKSTIW